MKHAKLSALVLAGALALSGCSHDPQINAAVGGLTGAAVGTQIGSGSGNVAAILGSAAIGTAVGGSTQVVQRR